MLLREMLIEISGHLSINLNMHTYIDELVNGWILTLFLYLKHSERNTALRYDTYEQNPDPQNCDFMAPHTATVSTDSFPIGVVSVPFEWVADEQTEYPMQFFAGFMAATQDQRGLYLLI